MDISAIFIDIYAPVVSMIFGLLKSLALTILLAVLSFFGLFLLRYRLWGKRLSPDRLAALPIRFRPYSLMRWVLWDILTRKERAKEFREYGFTIYVGRQGSGKTVSMVEYLHRMKEKYPACQVVTNFACSVADYRMESWRDLMRIRNGTDGVIFAIDEIHSEYSSADWKDFPESLLSEISQQRKQRIKIVATSQVFSRVAKPIREQAFSVVVCCTWLGRLTFQREYDAAEYSTSDTPYQVKKKCKPIWRDFFVQSNALRRSYDTYEKIRRMDRLEFIPRGER